MFDELGDKTVGEHSTANYSSTETTCLLREQVCSVLGCGWLSTTRGIFYPGVMAFIAVGSQRWMHSWKYSTAVVGVPGVASTESRIYIPGSKTPSFQSPPQQTAGSSRKLMPG